MLTSFNQSFDKSQYPKTRIGKAIDGAKVSVAGTLALCKKNCANGPMFYGTLTCREGKIGASVFPENPLFTFCETMPVSCEAIVYGTVSVNGKFVNVLPENIEYYSESSLPATEFNVATSNVYKRLIEFVGEIEDDFLRNVVNTIYENERTMKRFLAAPASEYSAGSFLGGLATRTVETCKLAHLLCSVRDEKSPNLGANADMVLAAALLCNIGRAYMYDIDSDGKFYKNEYATLDTDTALTRDAVRTAIKDTMNMKDEDGERLYSPKNADTVKELIHMLDTSKSMISMNASLSPRTRNASVLAYIIGLTNSVGTFDKLESSNLADEKLVRAFEGGKTYFLPEV